MAYIDHCRICRGTTVNSDIHPECRSAFLEDLLFQIKAHFTPTLNTVFLPVKLMGVLREESFKPLSEFRKSRDNEADLAIKKQMWELAKQEYMQKASDQFEKKNPDPDPPRY